MRQTVNVKELSRLVDDLNHTRPGPGLLRAVVGLGIVVLFQELSLSSQSWWGVIGWAIPWAFAYASLLILTHDALHHTLTGWVWFDEIFPRLVAYPAFWPHGTYKELHTLHHKMNSSDLQDPERIQWSQVEYENASPFGQWSARNQWWFHCLVLTGFGFTAHHIRQALRLGKRFPRVRKALVWDACLGLPYFIIFSASFFYFGIGEKYFVAFILLQVIAGGVMQFRSQIEHYGLWGKQTSALETQILSSRNIKTPAFVSWYFNRLNFHSAHHAYPRVPFYHLPEVHRRLTAKFAGSGKLLPESEGYLKTALRLSRVPRFITQSEM